MRKKLLLSAMGLLLSVFTQAQTTVTFKPNHANGPHATVKTNGGACATWPTSTDDDNENIFSMAWTFNNIGCTDGYCRSLFKFNQLSTIPSNAVVTSATLKLYGVPSSYNSASGNSGNNVTTISRVTSPWDSVVTWVTQPTTTSVNQLTIPSGSTTWNWNYTNTSADLTAMVQNMISNPAQNYGFMLRLQSESIYKALVFASSDHPDSTLRPELIVTYTVPVDTCNTQFEYSFTTLSPNQVSLVPLSLGAQSTYTWTINGSNYNGQGITHTFPGNGAYNVCLNQQLGNGQKCQTKCADICIGTGVGLNVVQFEQGFEVNIAPNPSRNNWNIHITAPKPVNTQIMVTDISGKEVLQQSAVLRTGKNELNIEVATLSSGIYFLKMVSDNGKIITHNKLIKE